MGLTFNDKSLLARALTHSSFLNEYPEFPITDNERLEFLGDAVLDFVIGEFVYNRFPEKPEGDLTNLRAALVRRETLADLARRIQLGEFLRLGRGEEETGGRQRPATLCAAFEAFVGALYLDQGLDRVRQFVLPMLDSELTRLARAALQKDPKSRLQEWSQAELHATPHYKTILESGPDHAKQFTVQVTVASGLQGTGVGPSKQAAAQSAASDLLEKLHAAGRIGHPLPPQR